MKKTTEIFNEKERTYSFELFPPKTEQGMVKLEQTIGLLAKLDPDFISVTYGAGGSSRDKTLEIVDMVQKQFGITGVSHLTCVCHTRDEIKKILSDIRQLGIHNVLALRGDPPKDQPGWQPGPDNFKYSSELCAFIRQHFGDYFGIGVAGFPEGHLLCPDREQDAKFLRLKTDAGADFVITQLFFNNQDYFDYVKRLRKLGVQSRVIPGILPITDFKAVLSFSQLCGSSVPQKLHDIFGPIAEDKDRTLQAGIDFCIGQCRELLDGGAPGLHFYTLNKVSPVDLVLKEVRR